MEAETETQDAPKPDAPSELKPVETVAARELATRFLVEGESPRKGARPA